MPYIAEEKHQEFIFSRIFLKFAKKRKKKPYWVWMRFFEKHGRMVYSFQAYKIGQYNR